MSGNTAVDTGNANKKVTIILATATLAVTSLLTLVITTKDIWKELKTFGTSENELVNRRLFEYHFKHQPIHSKQIVINTHGPAISVSVDIYENGDVYVSSSRGSQWFPAHEIDAYNQFSFLNSAYAMEPGKYKILTGKYKQENELKDDKVIRKRTYDSGKQEILTIDKNSGNILEQRVIDIPQEQRPIRLPIEPEQPAAATPQQEASFFTSIYSWYKNWVGEKKDEMNNVLDRITPNNDDGEEVENAPITIDIKDYKS